MPEVTAAFWVLKGLSTAMGESTSDFLVHFMAPQLAVVFGFVGFVASMVVQFTRARNVAYAYWFAVAMVGVFGTMAADVLHVGLGVPYTATTILYAAVLATVFLTWQRTEKTPSIHSIDSPRREGFYWATVVATFALGTALGDFTAYTLHLGYFTSAAVFAGAIVVPALGHRALRWNSVAAFWSAYVVTRPLGAAIADGMGKPKDSGGVGLGAGAVASVLAALIVVLVTYQAIGAPAQRSSDLEAAGAGPDAPDRCTETLS